MTLLLRSMKKNWHRLSTLLFQMLEVGNISPDQLKHVIRKPGTLEGTRPYILNLRVVIQSHETIVMVLLIQKIASTFLHLHRHHRRHFRDIYM